MAIEVPTGEPTAAAVGWGPAAEHLTLRFLGEVPAERVPDISSALASAAGASSAFRLVLEGVGAFPDARRPRVVWVGATEGRREAIELAERVAESLAPITGERPREPFVPHLTLFRVRSPAERRRAEELLAGRMPPPPPRTVSVREICLKESVLDPGGARHRTLAAWPLAPA